MKIVYFQCFKLLRIPVKTIKVNEMWNSWVELGVCLDMGKNLSILSIVAKLLSTNGGAALPPVPDRSPV